jgi:starch synthase
MKNPVSCRRRSRPSPRPGGLGDVSAALPGSSTPSATTCAWWSRCTRASTTRGASSPRSSRDRVLPRRPHGARRRSSPRRCPGAEVPVYFVRCPALYDRPTSTTAAATSTCASPCSTGPRCGSASTWLRPDIIHVNDWQTCLIPLLLRTLFAWDRSSPAPARCSPSTTSATRAPSTPSTSPPAGLAPVADHLHQDHLREGRFSFLLTGILYANAITTVSPTYAREIQTPEHGVGLDGFLRSRATCCAASSTASTTPSGTPPRPADPHHFTADDLEGKERCKADLLLRRGPALPP